MHEDPIAWQQRHSLRRVTGHFRDALEGCGGLQVDVGQQEAGRTIRRHAPQHVGASSKDIQMFDLRKIIQHRPANAEHSAAPCRPSSLRQDGLEVPNL